MQNALVAFPVLLARAPARADVEHAGATKPNALGNCAAALGCVAQAGVLAVAALTRLVATAAHAPQLSRADHPAFQGYGHSRARDARAGTVRSWHGHGG